MQMFQPVRKNVFRWSTPDPEDDWMVVGHAFLTDGGTVLIDLPLVPGLLKN